VREAPDRAQPGICLARDEHGLGGRDLSARNRRQDSGQHVSKILYRAQRQQVDPETRAAGSMGASGGNSCAARGRNRCRLRSIRSASACAAGFRL